MKIEDLLKLIDAGFSKEEIMSFGKETTETVSKEEKQTEPAEKPAEKVEEKKEDVTDDMVKYINDRLANIELNLQKQAIADSTQPDLPSTDDLLQKLMEG